MALQDISTYTYKNIFSLRAVQFEKACVVSKPEKVVDYAIFWVKEGKGTYHIDFKKYDFEGNVLFFLSPGQVFSVETESIKVAYQLSFVKDFYCIETHDKEVSCNGVLFNNMHEAPLVQPNLKETAKLEFIIANLIEEFTSSDTAQYDMLHAYLKQFIVSSVRIKKEFHPLKNDEESKLFKDFSLLVDSNFTKLHAVSDYATKLGVSPKSLTKNFQKYKLGTPSDFIKNRIVLEAKRQLKYTDTSVKEIAYNLGFSDPAYFTRFFTKIENTSPKQFKKSL
ncbi:AraC family transcriptional regulator [Flavicella sediminum]|uniref:AraC family transcriptional regulator n=1 Tax=Flavicella sediminum TaxID=2585141 RepID=UPI00111FA7DF|nr:helix-turn-helix domain-containing protein [Flavicella sediminum]